MKLHSRFQSHDSVYLEKFRKGNEEIEMRKQYEAKIERLHAEIKQYQNINNQREKQIINFQNNVRDLNSQIVTL